MKLCRPFGTSAVHRMAPYLHLNAWPSPQRGLALKSGGWLGWHRGDIPTAPIEGHYRSIPRDAVLQELDPDCCIVYPAWAIWSLRSQVQKIALLRIICAYQDEQRENMSIPPSL